MHCDADIYLEYQCTAAPQINVQPKLKSMIRHGCIRGRNNPSLCYHHDKGLSAVLNGYEFGTVGTKAAVGWLLECDLMVDLAAAGGCAILECPGVSEVEGLPAAWRLPARATPCSPSHGSRPHMARTQTRCC